MEVIALDFDCEQPDNDCIPSTRYTGLSVSGEFPVPNISFPFSDSPLQARTVKVATMPKQYLDQETYFTGDTDIWQKSSKNTNIAESDYKNFLSSTQLPWAEQFRPDNSDQLIGNQDAITSIREWLQSWITGKESAVSEDEDDLAWDSDIEASTDPRALVVHGPTSSGKTSTVYSVASELGYVVNAKPDK
jgi:hypothetical protein